MPTRLSAYDGIESNKWGNMWTLKTKSHIKQLIIDTKKGLSLLFSIYNRTGLNQSCFGLFNQGGESQLVVNGDIGQDLAIDLDGSLLQTVDQTAVGQTVLTGCCVDMSNHS